MLQVPSCAKCNDDYQRIEDRLRIRLALGLPDNDPHTKGISARVRRSVDARSGKNASDARYRFKRLARLRDEMYIAPPAIWSRTLATASRENPTWLRDLKTGLWSFGLPAVRFAPDDLSAMTVKFVKGLFRVNAETAIRSEVPISVPVVRRDGWKTVSDLITRYKLPTLGALGFCVWGVLLPDKVSSFWFFSVWNRLLLFGTTGELAQDD
jgi:hypothetical protein